MIPVEQIAIAAHELNRTYAASIGETPKPAWLEAPEDQRASCRAGVAKFLAEPESTPEQMHQSWMAMKEQNGWTFGPLIDQEKKEHPCMVPYDQLPEAQRVKDYLFSGIVRILSGLDVPDAAPAPTTASPTTAATKLSGLGVVLPVKYVGKRPTYKEGMYGSGLVFEQGQTKLLPADLARKLLGHPDVYAMGTIENAQSGVIDDQDGAKRKAAETEEDEHQRFMTVQALKTMNRAHMAKYAKQNFNMQLDPEAMQPDEMRAKIIQLLDQFGLPK